MGNEQTSKEQNGRLTPGLMEIAYSITYRAEHSGNMERAQRIRQLLYDIGMELPEPEIPTFLRKQMD